MRVSLSLAAAALAASATFVLAPAASAHNAPGDNGTIKIHDAKTGEELVKNEPHVCTFYLDAFFFDGRQQAAWKIVDQPPTGHEDVVASTGAITLDAAGHGRTGDLSLPDGHYKLSWNFDGEHGQAKQKVFWVDCADQGGASAGGATSGSDGGSTSGSGSGGSTAGSAGGGASGGVASGGAAGAPTGTPTVADTSSPAAGGGSSSQTGGNLAETGASVIGVGGAALVLLVAGAAILLRRRAGRQH
jgi:hypothetical protein